jgi:puromycin-sensitive aminopeptidase
MPPHRLPTSVVPSRYDIRLEPDLTTASFSGHVAIALTVREPVSEIVLNAAELTLTAARLSAGDGESLPQKIDIDEAAELVRLPFVEPLPPGQAVLRLDFTGTLNDKLRGFYRSKYALDGQERWLAATQFEATDARRCFPCWDEPAFKAVFASTLAVDPALTVLSNTRVIEEKVENGKKVVRFADTIPMSTYLVAFVVGELEASEPVLVGETPLRVWCVPGKRRLAAFGQAIGAFSLGHFEAYYGRKYPGDKLDLVAVPDFAAGAMENLGCITFRETALLIDEAASTHAERERVADVVAHENAHMWFGDLVTMAWWNGLWLNEAFATFMQMLAVDAWKPEWRRWQTFAVSRAAALAVDGLRSTRPVEFPVEAPRDAEAMFDVLTYEKGASVLRMLEQYLGPQVFRDGVRVYLERHAFGSTETADLWAALGGASGQPIPQVMDGWVFRPGYPLITARVEAGKLVLAQQRFAYLPPGVGEDVPQSWQVPVQVRLYLPDKGERVERLLLSGAEASLDLPAGLEAALVNEGGHGFYRVRYASDLMQRLLRRLPAGLPTVDRFNLVNDAWAAVLAGLTPLADFLDGSARFRPERDRNVWSVLLGAFAVLHRLVEPVDRPRLEALVRDRLGPAVAELGWQARPGEDELTRQLRADLLRAYGTLGNDAATHAHATEVFASGTSDADLLAAVVPVLAFAGGPARYDDFDRRRRQARTPQEEQRFLMALAAFRLPELADHTLGMVLSGDVRVQDAPALLKALLLNVDARARAWDFVRQQWGRLESALPLAGLKRVVEGTLGLVGPEWERQAREFFRERKVDLGGKALEQVLEQLHVLVRLREREGTALREYLAEGA